MIDLILTLDQKQVEDAKRLLNPVTVDRVCEDSVFDIASFLETKSTMLLQERIYSQPESVNYTRTGTALGSVLIKQVSKNAYYVLRDTRIKWLHKNKKRINYAPFLNMNKRYARFNTYFWDDSIKATQDEAKKILNKNIKYELSK